MTGAGGNPIMPVLKQTPINVGRILIQGNPSAGIAP